MPTKTQILDDVDSFSAVDLTRFINEGVVTMDELEETYELSAQKRRDIIDNIANGEIREWEKACAANTEEAFNQYLKVYPSGKYAAEARAKIVEIHNMAVISEEKTMFDEACLIGTEEAYRSYLGRYPNGYFAADANKRINDIHRGMDDVAKLRSMIENDEEILTENGQLRVGTPADVLKLLGENQNIIDAATVKNMLGSNLITSSDLKNLGINESFIAKIFSHKQAARSTQQVEREKFLPPTVVTGINTEIYFWGIPASGKTCAIGAIVSAAKKTNIVKNVEAHNDSKAYYYMTPLVSKFVPNRINELPEGTAAWMINEMKYTFTNHNGMEHKVAFLDLAGEIFTCMYRSDAGYTLSTEQETTLENLTTLLKRPENRKMHFFVIQYGAEDKIYEDLPQNEYLEAATAYIKSHDVFTENTDSIYIIITKTDQIPADVEDKTQHLKDYLNENFHNLYRNLDAIREKHEINGGHKVEIIPMTLGEVCFQNYCLFNPNSASNVVKKIMEKTVATKPKSGWRTFTGLLKG